MPRVRFSDVDLEAEVPAGTTILEAARRAGAPVGSHCGGVCACSKCHVYVEGGALSPMADDEREMLDLAARELRPESRLGCQARLLEGTVTLRISQESFEEYLDGEPHDRERALRRWLSRR
jgi:ferredoxin, 2Fe-2S